MKTLFKSFILIVLLSLMLYSSFRYFFLGEKLVKQELILAGYQNINIIGSKLFYMDMCEKYAIRKKFIAQKDDKSVNGYVCINTWLSNKIIID